MSLVVSFIFTNSPILRAVLSVKSEYGEFGEFLFITNARKIIFDT